MEEPPAVVMEDSSSEASPMMNIIYSIFGVLILLLVCANTRTRATMTRFLRFLGVSVKRSPRVIKELKRKGFHFSGLIIPFIYMVGMHTGYLDRYRGGLLMLFCTFVYFTFECMRLCFPSINNHFGEVFKGLMRDKEKTNFTGSFFYMMGATISIVFFRYHGEDGDEGRVREEVREEQGAVGGGGSEDGDAGMTWWEIERSHLSNYYFYTLVLPSLSQVRSSPSPCHYFHSLTFYFHIPYASLLFHKLTRTFSYFVFDYWRLHGRADWHKLWPH